MKSQLTVSLGGSIFDLMRASRVVRTSVPEIMTDTFEVACMGEEHELELSLGNERALSFGLTHFCIISGIAAHVTSLMLSPRAGSPLSRDWIPSARELISSVNSSGLHPLPLAGSSAMPLEEIELFLTKGQPHFLDKEKKIAMAAWTTGNGDRVVVYLRRLHGSSYLEVFACVSPERESHWKLREQAVRKYFRCDPDNLLRLGGNFRPADYLGALKDLPHPR